jgi:TolB-like protein/Tfp pilus assembly protein PilF
VRKALETVLKSRSFARAEQLRHLLQYVVEATIEGRASTVKEMTIGIDVFDLPTDFDPKRDPVVRMAMRRLRDRLQKYYTYEGAADPVLISLEPGSYIPRFLPHRNEQEPRVPIAVLPFGSLQEGAGQENCGVLLREALLTRLAENKTFRLIGNEAPQSFWVSSDLGSIGRQLQVRFVVRGACFASTETIRVCTELLRPQTDECVWSGNHEQDASREIWTVQNDIAVDLERQALAADGRQQAATAEAVREVGVHRLMLQGRHYLLQNNSESIKKAQQCFAAVIDKHPESAKASAALSITHSLTAMYHLAPASPLWEQAEAAAKKALTLGPTISESHIAMGFFIVSNRFEPVAAEQYFRRAFEANSTDILLPLMHAMACLAPLGKLQEAEDELETLLASDPLNPKALQMMAVILYFQRRYNTAIQVGQSALDILPGSAVASLIIATCYDRLGQQEEALKYYRKCDDLIPFMRSLRWSLVVAATYKGRSKWVRPTVLAIAKLLHSSPRAPSTMLADLLIRIGERELAISWIERAFRERAFRALYLGVDPAFDSVRSDPRCIRLLKHFGGPMGSMSGADVKSESQLA